MGSRAFTNPCVEQHQPSQDRWTCVWLIWVCTPHHVFLIKVSLFPDMLGLFPTFGESKPVVTQQCLSGAPFQHCVSTTALDSRLPNTFSKADVFPRVWKPRAVFPDTCWTWCGRLNSCFCRWFEITNRGRGTCYRNAKYVWFAFAHPVLTEEELSFFWKRLCVEMTCLALVCWSLMCWQWVANSLDWWVIMIT